MEKEPQPAAVQSRRQKDGQLILLLSGQWQLQGVTPSAAAIWPELEQARQLAFDCTELREWDSSLLTFARAITARARTQQTRVELGGLPAGARQLLALAQAGAQKKQEKIKRPWNGMLAHIGADARDLSQSTGEMVAFIGAVTLAMGRLVRGQARFRVQDLGLFIQETGGFALPIVALISFLVGLILAFVSIMQLELFGAQIYVADMVGIAMVRSMAAVMTGIIMAGRSGAAFAAQLGTMQVNEEIDALTTYAISPMDFLVLPRVLALSLMMPLLTLFADLMGILGGAVIAVHFYGIKHTTFFLRVCAAVDLNDLFVGLFTGLIAGILVALAGCLRGLQCGRNAAAVGDAATSAVVTSIIAIVIATAVIIVICAVLGI
ncbi:MAG: ABC transporter permease [Thermodesulfobacteriota bacterium]